MDKCAGTVCVGTQKNCDDSNQCTSDSCALGSCTYTPVTKIIDCYTGPIVSKGVGPCKGGKAQCSNGTLGSCVGEVTPAAEACDGKDNDCDASIDEDFSVGAVCDSSDFDACKQGVIECTGTASTRCAGDGPVVWAPFETVTGIKTSNLGWGGGNVFMGGTAKQVAGTAGFGSGIQLNGVNDYVQFQNYPDLQGSQANLSLALWVKREALGDHCFICKKGTGNTDEIYFGTVNNEIVLKRGNVIIASGIRFVQLGQWTHLAVQLSTTSASFYVNGTRYGTASISGATTIGVSTVWLSGATSNTATTSLKGAVDEIQIWKKALTNTQFNAESRASREACDGGDSNCNGQVDEGFTKAAGACDGADADVCKQGTGQICHPSGGQSYCQGDGAVDTFRMNATSLGWQAPSDNGPGSPFLLYDTTIAAGKHDGALVFDGTGYARQEADATNGKDRDLIAFYAFWARFDGDGNMALLSNSSKDGTSRLFVGRRNGVLHATAMGTEKSFAGMDSYWGGCHHQQRHDLCQRRAGRISCVGAGDCRQLGATVHA